MNTSSAHLSDLELAIAVARRLFLSGPRPSVHEPDHRADPAWPYVRFDGKPLEQDAEPGPGERPAERIPAAVPVAVPSPVVEARLMSFNSWEQCIIWCNQLTGADASFVIDSQGFIIANYGRIPPDGLDGLGAELCYAVEMLNKISPGFGKVAWVDLDYDNSRIVGFQVRNAADESFILGFLSPNASYFSQKITISRAISNSLGNIV